MIFNVIGVLIIVYSIKDYKKGLIYYLGFKLFLVNNISLISIPKFPLLTLEDFMNIVFIFIFLLKQSQNKISICSKFEIPWQLPFFLLMFSLFLSSLFGKSGVLSEITACMKYLVENVLFIWIIWDVIETKDDFIVAFKVITIVMLIASAYGIIEYGMKNNPLQKYEATLINDESKMIIYEYSTLHRGYRINSIFSHPIGAGINYALYVVMVVYLFINNEKEISNNIIFIITAVSSIICLLLVKMRSPLLFFVISCLGTVNLKRKRTYILLFACIFLLGILIIFGENFLDIYNVFLSFFNKESAAIVGGSNFDMRINQLHTALNIVKESPIVGLGFKYKQAIDSYIYEGILGSEGLLLFVLPSFGFFGLFSFLFYYNYSIIKIPRYFKSRQLKFLMLGYFLTYLLSSLPGFKIHLLYIFAFYIIKSGDKYTSYNGEKQKEFCGDKIRFIYK